MRVGVAWLRRRRWRVALTAMVMTVGVALAVVQIVDVRRTDHERARIVSTTRAARAKNGELGDQWLALMRQVSGAQGLLIDSQSQAQSAASDLAATSDAHDEAVAALERLRSDLAGTRRAVTHTQAEAQQGAALTEALSACMTGVAQLLNQLSVGDDAGAAHTADRIRGPCDVVGMAVTA